MDCQDPAAGITINDQLLLEKCRTIELLSKELEQYLVKFHLSCVAAFKDASFQALFNAMMASDQGHIAAIKQFYQKVRAEAGELQQLVNRFRV